MNNEYKSLSMYRLFVMCLVILSLTFFTGCEKEDDEPAGYNTPGQAGELVDVSFLISFTPDQAQTALTQFGAPIGINLSYTVDAYRIYYKTRDKNGDLIKTSGVLIFPQDLENMDLVSVQHGTVLKRDRVGSISPFFAIDGFLFAMNGFMTAVPDYIGLGISEEIHPYLHAELTANAVIDMLRATRIYALENGLTVGDNIFLAGYSEGGYATMAAQKYIESEYADEFQLTAVAPMSGPYDMLGSTQNLLSRDSFDIPAFLAYVVVAYNDIYGWNRLTDIFNDPYASMLPNLYNGSQTLWEVNDLLPTAIDSLFNSDFLTAFLAGEEADIQQVLEDNSLLDWGPIAPVRLYHGTADSTVSLSNTLNAYQSLRANGGVSVDLFTLLGAGHTTGFFPSMILAETWFDSIRTASQ